MATTLTDSQIARLTKPEIRAMDAQEVKSILKRLGVKVERGSLAARWYDYKSAVTDIGLLGEMTNRMEGGKEWLVGFIEERLKSVCSFLRIDKEFYSYRELSEVVYIAGLGCEMEDNQICRNMVLGETYGEEEGDPVTIILPGFGWSVGSRATPCY